MDIHCHFFHKYKCSGAGAVRNHCMLRREIKRLGDDFALAANRPDGICSKGIAIDSRKRLCNMKLRCAAPPILDCFCGAANTRSLGDGGDFCGGSSPTMLPWLGTGNISSTIIRKMPSILQVEYALICHDW